MELGQVVVRGGMAWERTHDAGLEPDQAPCAGAVLVDAGPYR
jgi:hypothetical protein